MSRVVHHNAIRRLLSVYRLACQQWFNKTVPITNLIAVSALTIMIVSISCADEVVSPEEDSEPSGAQEIDLPKDDQGYFVLFNGTSLRNWRGYQQQAVSDSWRIEDNALFGTGKGPDLITVNTFRDFELEFQWKIEANGNSGVIYRATEAAKRAHRTGIEYQIFDDKQGLDATPPIFGAGAIYGLYGTADKTLYPAGEYNESRIVVRGKHLEHWLNASRVAQCEIGSPDWNQKIAASKFESWSGFAKHARGHIALQAHNHPVWFRQIRIKLLQAPQETD